jgi:hypothetical protein
MTMEYQIQTHGLTELTARLNGSGKTLNRHLKRAMNKSVILVVSNVRPLVPVGVSGRLHNSIGSEVIENGIGDITGRVGSSLKDEEYPAVMEYGRKPGSMPPWEALVRWVHVKHIAGTYSVKTHKRSGEKNTQQAEDESAAFAIARKIAREGIQGRHFMQEGFDKSIPQIEQFFEQAAVDFATEIEGGT